MLPTTNPCDRDAGRIEQKETTIIDKGVECDVLVIFDQNAPDTRFVLAKHPVENEP